MTLFCRLVAPMKASAIASGAALVTGWLAADLLSGLTHWFFDTWLSPNTPWIGRALVRPFREHHVDPRAICRHDFVETNGTNWLGGSFLMLCGLCAETASAFGAYAASSLFFTALFVSATGQIHKWAHAADHEAPPLIAWLQRIGIVLSREAHARHHRAPFDRAYCITSGQMNPALERLRFFGALERVIFAMGVRPRKGGGERPRGRYSEP